MSAQVVARGRAYVAIAAAGAFGLVTGAVAHDQLVSLDTAGIYTVRGLSSGGPAFVGLMRAFSFLAGTGAFLIAVGIAVVLWRRGSARTAIWYAATCLSGWAANIFIKEVARHHRPVGLSPKLTDAGWYSYPSGHAMLAVLVIGVGADLLTRTAQPVTRALTLAAAAALILAIALSRVYLGAHWPSDVVGAVLAGVAWGAGAEALFTPYGDM
jgi:undecaprenyl-diphosphatase